MKIYSIGEDAKEHWVWIRPYIEQGLALSPEAYTPSDALSDVLSGSSLFLVCSEGDDVLSVSKVDIRPDVLHFHTMAGKDMKKWVKPLISAAEGIAKSLQLKYITSISRPGVGRILEQAGCKRHMWYMVREV